MGKVATLPTYGAALVDAGGRASAEYYRYFQSLNTNLFNYNAIEAQIADLESRVPALTSDVLGIDSVTSSGHLSRGTVRVSLLNDVANPAKTQYYGTDSTSTHGWYSLYNVVKAEVIGSTNVTVTPDDTVQTLTVDLANLANSGIGSLLAITRDAKGRISGSRAVVPSDIPGGSILPMVNGDTPPTLMYGGKSLIYARVA
jgi:hypothetical protein